MLSAILNDIHGESPVMAELTGGPSALPSPTSLGAGGRRRKGVYILAWTVFRSKGTQACGPQRASDGFPWQFHTILVWINGEGGS